MSKQLFYTASEKIDTRYSKKVNPPQYLPSAKPPVLSELYNYDKYAKLLREINDSSISDDEKKFLRMAASRHIVFNYSKIADYYAHATPEMQELMEQSALVILDIDDAIANGYVKLSKDITKLLEDSGVPAGGK